MPNSNLLAQGPKVHVQVTLLEVEVELLRHTIRGAQGLHRGAQSLPRRQIYEPLTRHQHSIPVGISTHGHPAKPMDPKLEEIMGSQSHVASLLSHYILCNPLIMIGDKNLMFLGLVGKSLEDPLSGG